MVKTISFTRNNWNVWWTNITSQVIIFCPTLLKQWFMILLMIIQQIFRINPLYKYCNHFQMNWKIKLWILKLVLSGQIIFIAKIKVLKLFKLWRTKSIQTDYIKTLQVLKEWREIYTLDGCVSLRSIQIGNH